MTSSPHHPAPVSTPAPHPAPVIKKTPVWAWAVMGSLSALLLITGVLFIMSVVAFSQLERENAELKEAYSSTGQFTGTSSESNTGASAGASSTSTAPTSVRLAASADGEATLRYTNIKGDETEVKFTDTIVVDARFNGDVAGATVYKSAGSGDVICSFLEPDNGPKLFTTHDKGEDSDLTYYMCFAALTEE